MKTEFHQVLKWTHIVLSLVALFGSGTYRFAFELQNVADTMEIVPPEPTSPVEIKMNADIRKLCFSFIKREIA
jgi:hypothetical protein